MQSAAKAPKCTVPKRNMPILGHFSGSMKCVQTLYTDVAKYTDTSKYSGYQSIQDVKVLGISKFFPD